MAKNELDMALRRERALLEFIRLSEPRNRLSKAIGLLNEIIATLKIERNWDSKVGCKVLQTLVRKWRKRTWAIAHPDEPTAEEAERGDGGGK